MPDPQDNTQQPQQGGMLGGTPVGISGGTNFFGSLVKTLITGAVQGGVQALAQNQSNPRTRAMAAGINAPQIQAQQKAQQQEQADEATLRKQRIAMGQLYELQTKHMLAQADKATQYSIYNTARDFHDQLDQQGMVDWVGGTNEDPSALRSELSRQKAAHPDQDVRIVPKGGTTADSPLYQIAIARKGGIPKAIDLTGVAGNDKLPAMPVHVSEGTDASDAAVSSTHAVRNGVAQNIQSGTAKPLANQASMISLDELQKDVQNSGYPPIKNLSNIYAYATEGDASGLGSKTTRGRDGIEYGKDDAEEFIRESGMFPDFNPKQAAEDKDTITRLENYSKGEGIKDWPSANSAVNFASDTLKENPKNPKIQHLAQSLYTRATDLRAQFPTPKQLAEKKDEGHADRMAQAVQNQISREIVPIQQVITKDQDKFDDLSEGIDMLNKGGGEFDAIAKIKTLRGTVGGGGVRITGAELNSIGAPARSWMGDVEVWLSRATDKTVEALTPPQRAQLKDILNTAYNAIATKHNAYIDAENSILHANSYEDIRNAQSKLTEGLRAKPQPIQARAVNSIGGAAIQPDGKTPYPEGHTGKVGTQKAVVKGGTWQIQLPQ